MKSRLADPVAMELPDHGDLPRRLDKRREHPFRWYSIKSADTRDLALEPNADDYKYTLAEAMADADRRLAAGDAFVAVCWEDGRLYWEPPSFDEGEWSKGEWRMNMGECGVVAVMERGAP